MGCFYKDSRFRIVSPYSAVFNGPYREAYPQELWMMRISSYRLWVYGETQTSTRGSNLDNSVRGTSMYRIHRQETGMGILLFLLTMAASAGEVRVSCNNGLRTLCAIDFGKIDTGRRRKEEIRRDRSGSRIGKSSFRMQGLIFSPRIPLRPPSMPGDSTRLSPRPFRLAFLFQPPQSDCP